MTERLQFHFSLSCIGEGNGNSLQCSCLENPREWGAWWAAVYVVAQSRTRLKWLSSKGHMQRAFCITDSELHGSFLNLLSDAPVLPQHFFLDVPSFLSHCSAPVSAISLFFLLHSLDNKFLLILWTEELSSFLVSQFSSNSWLKPHFWAPKSVYVAT